MNIADGRHTAGNIMEHLVDPGHSHVVPQFVAFFDVRCSSSGRPVRSVQRRGTEGHDSAIRVPIPTIGSWSVLEPNAFG